MKEPTNAGDVGSVPVLGGSHMPRGGWACVRQNYEACALESRNHSYRTVRAVAKTQHCHK